MVAIALSTGGNLPSVTSPIKSVALLNLCIRVHAPDFTSQSTMTLANSSSILIVSDSAATAAFKGAAKSEAPSFHHLDPAI